MKNKRTLFQSVLYIISFAIIGIAIGLVVAFIMAPNFGGVFFWTLATGLLDSIYLSWVYKSREINVNLVIRTGIGIAAGMFLGTFFGGMLGTIMSIPFPDTFVYILFPIGTFGGMFMGGARLPIILVDRGSKSPK